MITLHQFARVWGTPNLSPFCCKVETYLRIARIPYEVADTFPPTAPKGKLPYLTDDGETISDSRFIVEYLKAEYDADLDRALSASQRAQSVAFQRMIEDDLGHDVLEVVAAAGLVRQQESDLRRPPSRRTRRGRVARAQVDPQGALGPGGSASASGIATSGPRWRETRA